MPVLVSLVAAFAVTVVVMLVASYASGAQTAMGDPLPAERWLVDHIARHRRGKRIVEVLDRWVWGGSMVGLAIIAVFGAAAVIGWLLVSVGTESGFAEFDESVADWGSSNATPLSTDVLGWVTELGGTTTLIVALALVGIIEVARDRPRNWSVLGFLLTVGVGISLVNNGLKAIIDRERPEVLHLVESGGSSFPSGHTAAAAACWAALALVASRRMPLGWRRWAASIGAAVAVMVASSRVLLGVHWLTDVVAGLVTGWTWCFLVALVFGGRLQRFGEPAERLDTQEQLDRGPASVDGGRETATTRRS